MASRRKRRGLDGGRDAIARAILYAIEQPENVDLSEMIALPAAQA